METPSPPKVYSHPDSRTTILPPLRQLLPWALPLYRRLQNPHRSEHSHVLATFAPHDALLPPCFAVAYVDRTRRPETECWLFLSGEVPGRCIPVEKADRGKGRRGSTSAPPCRQCAKALYALLEHIAKQEVPASVHRKDEDMMTIANSSTDDKHEAATRDAYLSYLSNPSIILIGAVSTLTRQILNLALLAPRAYIGGDSPWAKYLFHLHRLGASDDLPEGLRWGSVREKDFALVRRRASIPRRNATLRLLPSLAIFPAMTAANRDPDPIAWAFLGLDASLSTLHVEPDYRGKGLAKKLAAKLMREGHEGVYDVAGEDGGGLAHTDTAEANAEANGVFKALGGWPGWTVYWLRVDLDRVREPLSSGALEAIVKLDEDLPKRERIWEQPPTEEGA